MVSLKVFTFSFHVQWMSGPYSVNGEIQLLAKLRKHWIFVAEKDSERLADNIPIMQYLWNSQPNSETRCDDYAHSTQNDARWGFQHVLLWWKNSQMVELYDGVLVGCWYISFLQANRCKFSWKGGQLLEIEYIHVHVIGCDNNIPMMHQIVIRIWPSMIAYSRKIALWECHELAYWIELFVNFNSDFSYSVVVFGLSQIVSRWWYGSWSSLFTRLDVSYQNE